MNLSKILLGLPLLLLVYSYSFFSILNTNWQSKEKKSAHFKIILAEIYRMNRFAARLYFYYFSFMKAAVYLLFYPFFLYLLPNPKYERLGHKIRRIAARTMFFLSRIKLELN